MSKALSEIIVKNLLLILYFILFVVNSKAQNIHSGELNGIRGCAPKTASIVVHIVYDSLFERGISENNILSDVDSLNAHFEPICLQFRVCEFRYVNQNRWNRMIDEDRREEIADVHNRPNMINVYYSMESSGGYLGYSPVGDTVVPSKDELRDAIFLQKGGGKDPMLYQFGNFFGLYPTAENQFGVELANGSNCETAGDKMCDTPADDGAGQVTPWCDFEIRTQDSNGDYYTPDPCNAMSNYEVCSYKRFTKGQYNRMYEVAIKGRYYLW